MPNAFNPHPEHPAIAFLVRLHADLGGRIVASFELDPMYTNPGEKRLTATTLAIRMDPKVAIELAERILALDLTRGWPQPR